MVDANKEHFDKGQAPLMRLIFAYTSTLKALKRKLVESTNSVASYEATDNESPHLDLQCLSSSLRLINII